jgi:DNA-binding protein HU-beta
LLDTEFAQRRVFTVNKAQLIDRLSGPLGSKKAAADAVDGVLGHIMHAVVTGERVALTGFGVFEKVHRPARTGRNPRTGASVKIKKTSVPKFKAGQSFKDVVSGARKLPKAASTTVRAATGTAKKAAPAKKVVAKKAAPAKKVVAKKAAPAKKVVAKKVVAKKAVAKKAVAKKAAPAKKAAVKKTAKKAVKR